MVNTTSSEVTDGARKRTEARGGVLRHGEEGHLTVEEDIEGALKGLTPGG